jgi:hypothetical protein
VPVLTLDPRTDTVALANGDRLAPRPTSLQGQRLGLVCNGLNDSEYLFDRLAAILEEQDGVEATVKVVKVSVSAPPAPDQWASITDRATVAITGFGGCGSCSTRSLRDALDLEAAGIPAVCIVHDSLVPAVRALAKFLGAPDYPVVNIGFPHDTSAHWTKDEATDVADRIVGAVRARLVLSAAG